LSQNEYFAKIKIWLWRNIFDTFKNLITGSVSYFAKHKTTKDVIFRLLQGLSGNDSLLPHARFDQTKMKILKDMFSESKVMDTFMNITLHIMSYRTKQMLTLNLEIRFNKPAKSKFLSLLPKKSLHSFWIWHFQSNSELFRIRIKIWPSPDGTTKLYKFHVCLLRDSKFYLFRTTMILPHLYWFKAKVNF